MVRAFFGPVSQCCCCKRLLLAAISVALLFAAGARAQTPIFQDDFDTLDLKVWKPSITMGGGGNWEFEWYTNNRSNLYVRDSILYIKPTLTADNIGEANLQNGYTMDIWGSEPNNLCTGNAFYGCSRTSYGKSGGNILNPIQSARIRTAESFSFTYGKLEVRAKMPRGDWLWPAIWLLPTWNQYGEWPASGEIDIIEARGNDASYPGGGINEVGSTLHWGPFYGQDQFPLTHATYKLPSGDFGEDFHVFGLIWSNTSIMTYVDSPSNPVMTVPITQSFWQLGGWSNSNLDNPWLGGGIDAPFDREFYIIFDVACGGVSDYFPDGLGGKPWSDSSPNAVNDFYAAKDKWYPTWQGEDAALQIDWIRVYNL